MNDWLTVTNWVPPVNDALGHFSITEEPVTRGHLGQVTTGTSGHGPQNELAGSVEAQETWIT